MDNFLKRLRNVASFIKYVFILELPVLFDISTTSVGMFFVLYLENIYSINLSFFNYYLYKV